ncbi:MAG: proprotein convertase P-domain-containing protein, partial [Flavobacteriales bacterium]|nr:proprotein convertase P-domain-containing protein [Flavobacteriales bacterium]
MKKYYKLGIVLALTTFSISVFSQTFSTGTNLTIPDSGPEVCSSIAVAGVGIIDGTYGLQTVTIKINHTYDGDLDIWLEAPDGTRVELSTDNGGGGNNYGSGSNNNAGPYTVFDMAGAAGLVTGGAAPFQNTYIPEGDLGNVNNGQNANGNWQLCITDDAGGDTGFLNAWQLNFTATPAPPPAPCTIDQAIGGLPFVQSGLTTTG